MTQTFTIKPKIHVEYLIRNSLMKYKAYKDKWWVVWYNHEDMSSAGIELFNSFEEASEWNEKNRPRQITEGNFTRSTIIYTGD